MITSIALALATALTANDPNSTTIKTSVHPVFAEGKLDGCAADFTVLHMNVVHAPTGPVGLQGSVNLMKANGGLAVLLKIGALDAAGARVLPATIGLISGFKTNDADLLKSAEVDAGFRSSVYTFGDSTMNALAGLASDGRLHAYYTLGQDKVSANFDVDLSVADYDSDTGKSVRAPEAAERFQACVDALAED